MPQHLRETILDNIVTMLTPIGDTSSAPSWGAWASTKPTAEARKIRQDAFSLIQFPNILVVPRGERISTRAVCGADRVYDSTLEVLLDIWLESWDMSNDLSAMLHDVIRLFGNDATISGSCRDSRITSADTLLLEEEQPNCGIQILVEIDYGYFHNNPTALA